VPRSTGRVPDGLAPPSRSGRGVDASDDPASPEPNRGGGLRPMHCLYEIRISDEGPGFAEGDSERISDKCYRANNVAGIPGSGLGPAICPGFIEAHGSIITATNRVDARGAVFCVTLPIIESSPPCHAGSFWGRTDR
jgi:signal transduction histidine kinase